MQENIPDGPPYTKIARGCSTRSREHMMDARACARFSRFCKDVNRSSCYVNMWFAELRVQLYVEAMSQLTERQHLVTGSELTSGSFLADMSVRSPQKCLIFNILKILFWIKVFKERFISLCKQMH